MTGLAALILEPWRTNARVTEALVAALPPELWSVRIPGSTRTVRQLAAHLPNSRSRWLKTLGEPLGIPRPPLVNVHRATQREVLRALRLSARRLEALLKYGVDRDGEIPATPAYTWRNLPLDVGHVLSYFVAHEAHHRGQLVMAARQLGSPLPATVANGLWFWVDRAASRRLARG